MPLSPQCATPPQCALTFSRSCLHLNSQLSSKRPVWRGPPLFRDSSPLREVTGAVGESRVIASWCSFNLKDHARITNTLCRKWEELGIYYLPEIAKWHSFPRDFGHVPHWCHRHICIWWDSHTVQICLKKKHPSALYCESVGTIVCFRGMCALEMTALELTDNGEKGGQVVSSHVFSIYSHHYVFYKFGIRWQQKPSRSASSPWRTSSKKISSDSAWSQTLPAALRPGTSSFTQSSSRWGEIALHFETSLQKHLLRFSVLIAFRYILSNFSLPIPLSRTQVWIDVNFLLVGGYLLLM